MPTPNKHTLYQLAAQNPTRDAALLLAIYGDEHPGPRQDPILGEDFSGTAALSRAWCALGPRHRAVAIDHDKAVLAHARPHPRVRLIAADVLKPAAPADLIAVQNFSICEMHTRATLVAYLRHARSRLRPHGALVCDLYGGSDAYATGRIRQRVDAPPGTLPRGTKLTYVWEQRTADPLTGRVVNAMHFELSGPAKGKRTVMTDAFVYDWRLWSPAELREAMLEAGFETVQAYHRTPDALDQDGRPYVMPITDAAELSDAFNIYVVARVGASRSRSPRLSTRRTRR